MTRQPRLLPSEAELSVLRDVTCLLTLIRKYDALRERSKAAGRLLRGVEAACGGITRHLDCEAKQVAIRLRRR